MLQPPTVRLLQLICVAVYGLLAGGKSAAMLRRGVNPVAVGVGKRGAAKVIEIALPLIVGLWLWVILRYALELRITLLPAALHTSIIQTQLAQAAGAFCVIAALLLVALAMRSFGDSWRIGVADPGRLVTRGAFAVSRNPFFLALNLYAFGAFLLNGTLILLLLAGLQLVLLHFQILEEERFLSARFAEYARYCAHTPRYFGWPRRSGR